MRAFIENEKIPGLPFIPRTLLHQGTWGEVWRATHDHYKNVIFIAYSSGEGEELFTAAIKGIRRWKATVGPATPHLLKIHEISDSAIPYILTEDPGDKTLAESMEHHTGQITLEVLARVVRELASGLQEAGEWELAPVGLAPEFIFRTRDGAAPHWRILPVGPTAPLYWRQSYCGKHLPPTTIGRGTPDPQHVDVYSLAMIWLELLRVYHRESGETERRVLLESGLREVLATCLNRIDGEYRQPADVATMIQEWLLRFHRSKDRITAKISAPDYRYVTPGDSVAQNADPLSSEAIASLPPPSRDTPPPPAPPSSDDCEKTEILVMPDAERASSTSQISTSAVKHEIVAREDGGEGADVYDEPTMLSGPGMAPLPRKGLTETDVKRPAIKVPQAPTQLPPAPPRAPLAPHVGQWSAPDSYELLEPLGSGSMARVYKARHRVLDRTVVLKVSTPKPGSGIEENPQRLLLEARTIAKLENDNIVRIHDCLIHMGQVHLVMEFVEGFTLGDLLRCKDPSTLDPRYRKMLAAPGRLKPEVVMDFGIQAARALDYAHRQGVIHRDVKPSNLLITPDGKAKLFDFSIAKVEADGESMTATGMILGSPAYMSPEQVERIPLDGRADLYALGCVLYDCLVGHPPFQDKSDVLLCLKQLKEDAPAPNTLIPEIPEELSRIVMRCLYKDRANRFGVGADLETVLKRQLDLHNFKSAEKKQGRPTADPAGQAAPRAPKEFEPVRSRPSGSVDNNGGGGMWIFWVVFLAALAVGSYFLFK